MLKKIDPKPDQVKIEKKILSFWEKHKIFDKLREKIAGQPKWSFLDGPITANNPMGVHHAWGRTYKDFFQRYKAMRGFDQRFQNGFDCQGLWVEVEVEKELGIKCKKDIENYGIDKFVEKCKERVKKYAKIQTEQSIRLGQWMDWENSYYTMSDENNYAIWHFLKTCQERGYLYKGKDAVPWCPRCGTAISQHEILTEEYQELTHDSIYLKLPIEGRKNSYFLVWTTTPWTIPGNVALAIDPEKNYGEYQKDGEILILIQKVGDKLLGGAKKYLLGKKLLGLKYQGPFDDLSRVEKARAKNSQTFHTVVSGKDLVTEEEGTGIIHIAPGAGSEDFTLGKVANLPVIELIDEAAIYLSDLGKLSGQNAKKRPEIILDYLRQKDEGKFVYKIEKYTHRYPTCWRCKEELVWRVVDEWYIGMDKLRKPLMVVSKKIKWMPEWGLDRELDWLTNMSDWLISKKRYWGLALPIWECDCGNFEVVGSHEELKSRAVEGWEAFDGHTPHRPWIDKVKIRCSRCNKLASRIPDVGNPWLDAGIVPFSTMGYFKDKKYWREWFPADFICESFPGQFRNWFYSVIAMSTVLENTNPAKTILGYALVRDEKGEEMHKSKGNAIWFDEAVEKMGADLMRWMYLAAPPYHNLNFGYGPAGKVMKRFLLIFWNVYNFFITYAPESSRANPGKSQNILDRWILSKLNNLIKQVTDHLEKYEADKASKKIEDFVLDLSTWYLRRSRKRQDSFFFPTLYLILKNLLTIMAPAMPALAEEIYQILKEPTDPESIHLVNWPSPETSLIDDALEEKMTKVRNTVEIIRRLREEAKIKLRQPLGRISVSWKDKEIPKEYQPLILDEANILEFDLKTKGKSKKVGDILVILDIEISGKLRKQGMVRELIRQIQAQRKISNLIPTDLFNLYWQTDDEQMSQILADPKFQSLILEKAHLRKIIPSRENLDQEIRVNQAKIRIRIK